MTIKTEDAKRWAGGTVGLAEVFNISHGAVSQWGETLPELRELQLKDRRPDWFFKNGNLKPPPVTAEWSPA